MCGRFVQIGHREDYEHYLQLLAAGERTPPVEEDTASWNVPPSSLVWVIRHLEGGLRLDRLTWGWTVGAERRLVSNARLEGAAEKPAFRDAWRSRRCAVPVEGWYEWQALGGGRKQPYYFALRSDEPVLLAGLWAGEGFVLLTTETRGPLAAVHTRRPVALPLPEMRRWCDPDIAWAQAELEQVMTPEEPFDLVPVSDAVNSTRRDGPELVQRLDSARIARADLLLPGF